MAIGWVQQSKEDRFEYENLERLCEYDKTTIVAGGMRVPRSKCINGRDCVGSAVKGLNAKMSMSVDIS